MTDLRQAAQQALEFIEATNKSSSFRLVPDSNLNKTITALRAALVAAAEQEKVAQWMIRKGYATGHGDTTEDLLAELEWQVAEREREACAKVAESYEPVCDVCPGGVSNAIRARGEA